MPLLPHACALIIAAAVTGCSIPTRLPAVPQAATEQASVLGGLPNGRFWADTQVADMAREFALSITRERAQPGAAVTGRQAAAHYLAVSGGSDDGAFGAGLLVGWTAAGTRPEFKLVTGVSTGALTAPFAFLGPSYDAQLTEVFTGINPSSVFARRGYLSVPFSDAMADTGPLFALISRYANDAMLSDIAREYRRGRLLLIGTTDLDVMRPVIWNIGAIAESGRPGALDLFRRILLASAAVPAVFPPVLIDVDVAGTPYQELHVDGGAVAQLFLYPQTLTDGLDLRTGPLARQRTAWVIRNARLDAGWAAVDRSVFTIAGRAVSSMIHYSGNNDLLRLQAATERDGIGFNLAYIGTDFTTPHVDDFDQGYMRALYRYGFEKARGGNAWNPSVPGTRARR